MPNKILSIRTLRAENPEDEALTIAISTNIDDASLLEPFVTSVCQQFKVYRTTCPALEYNLLITVIGLNCAQEFDQIWKRLVKSDPVLRAYTQNLVSAEVLVGTPQGAVIESASLLS